MNNMTSKDEALEELQGKWTTIQDKKPKTIEILGELLLEDEEEITLIWRGDVWVQPGGMTVSEFRIKDGQLHRFARSNGPFASLTLVYTLLV